MLWKNCAVGSAVCFSQEGHGSEVSTELLSELRSEALDLIESLASLCSVLHVNSQQAELLDKELVGELFRSLHTLKGLSQMAGLQRIVSALHTVEDFVSLVREGKAVLAGEPLESLSDLQDVLEKSFSSLPYEIAESFYVVLEKIAEVFEQAALNIPGGHASMTMPSPNQKDPVEISSNSQPNAVESENCFEATADEKALLQKYQARTEDLYAIIFPPGAFADAAALQSSEIYDSLSRVADFIVCRGGEDGSMLIFAAELEAAILESIVSVAVHKLPKDGEPCRQLTEPWSVFFFGLDEPNDLKNLKNVLPISSTQTASNVTVAQAFVTPDSGGSPKGVDKGQVAVTSTVQAISEPTAQPKAAVMNEDFEDFDTGNLLGQNSAALPELDPEMLQDFLSNVDELLDQLADSLLTLESNPTDKEAVDTIFRAAHTIKGTSGMFGFHAIERVCHIMENLFDRVRKGSVLLNGIMVDALLFGLDRIKAMFDQLKAGKSAELPINEALKRLAAAERGVALADPIANRDDKSVQKTVAVTLPNNPSVGGSSQASQQSVELAPQSSGGVVSEPNVRASGAAKGAAAPSKSAEGVGTIRVDLKRLDFLVNLVGELVIDRSRFARIEEDLRASNPGSEMSNHMSESVLLFSRHMNEVQSVIMKIRMVPVGNAFYKFTRVVRDLSKQIGKEIELVIEGGETELDKTLVEEIGDPLVHLIRNSVDHGIEVPEDRAAKGKARKGTILLKAAQDGNMIVITVKDDGKGLQTERIRAKGIANGLIKESDVLADKDIFNLIFEPGFSTAEKVTNISGRGVGMDVVKNNIVKLKGVIELDSTPGKGTCTTIKLPLTLAIIASLMVQVKGESFAIPLVNVIETIRIDPKDVQKVGNSEFVKLRSQVIPLLRLQDAFEMNNMDEQFWYRLAEEQSVKKNRSTQHTGALARRQSPRMIFVVVGVGEKRVGIVVDELMGQQEIVIKSLGKLMGRQRGLAGGCVLGNGRVALVLDAGELIDDFSLSNKKGHPNTPGINLGVSQVPPHQSDRGYKAS